MDCSSTSTNAGNDEARVPISLRAKRLFLAIAIGLQFPILAGYLAWFWADTDQVMDIMLQISVEVGIIVSCFLSHRILPNQQTTHKKRRRRE